MRDMCTMRFIHFRVSYKTWSYNTYTVTKIAGFMEVDLTLEFFWQLEIARLMFSGLEFIGARQWMVFCSPKSHALSYPILMKGFVCGEEKVTDLGAVTSWCGMELIMMAGQNLSQFYLPLMCRDITLWHLLCVCKIAGSFTSWTPVRCPRP